MQKSRRITTSFCLTYSHNGHQTILSEEAWNAFAYFAKNSSLDCPLLVDVTAQEMRLSQGENKSSTHSSSYRQIAKPKPTQQDTDKSKSRLDDIRKKDFSKVFICSLTKEEREHSVREMINEVKKENIFTTYNKKHTIKTVGGDIPVDCTPENLRKLFTTTEKRNFLIKKEKVMVVYGSSKLLLNPMLVQCPLCGNLIAIAHINNIMVENDKLIKHIKKVHFEDKTSSEYRGNYQEKFVTFHFKKY